MPTYVYACTACEREFEVEQRITEAPLTDCGCGSKGTVKRVIQPAGIMFVGSGFHINDYKSSGSGGRAEAKKDDAPTCSGEPGTCGACKPE